MTDEEIGMAILAAVERVGPMKNGCTLEQDDAWVKSRRVAAAKAAREVLSPRAGRNFRQSLCVQWVEDAFGHETILSPDERAARVIEEAIEFGQALGVGSATVARIAEYVFKKPPGDPAQEAGGVGLTLLAACGALGFSADKAEADELARVLSLPLEHFKRRQAEKRAAGMSPAIRSNDGPSDAG